MNRFTALAVLAMSVSMPCAASPASPAKPFSYVSQADLFGYYLPQAEIKTGKYKLTVIALATGEEFRAFAAGKRWNGKWAPILIEFAPAGSTQKPGPEGGSYWQGAFRVLPTAYRISGGTLSFVGSDKALGAVSFNGTIDLVALKAARQRGGSDKAVLRGDLKVGDRNYANLVFTWFGGD